MNKKIHIHLGPHKTGSTAIQNYLTRNADNLATRHKVCISGKILVNQIADRLAARDYIEAGSLASILSESYRASDEENFIISSEDLAGDLPGRSGGKRPYPQLWRNIQIFEKAFFDFERYYYFFIREKEEWLYSAYVQSLKHRTKFKSYIEFCSAIEHDRLWEEVVQKSKKMLGSRLILVPFENNPDNSSIEKFCVATSLFKDGNWPTVNMLRSNTSPIPEEVKLLELINQAHCTQSAVAKAKEFILGNQTILPHKFEQDENVQPGNYLNGQEIEIPAELQALWDRSQRQIHTQTQPDLLPDIEADWNQYRYKIVEQSDEFPAVSRQRMEDQKKILEYRFQGLPETCFLLGLSISYLRRDTQHTENASQVYQRLWQQEYPLLLALLPTRWLISSFQTFADHGKTQEQRLIGTAGFFFGNLMKVYEGERSMEGNPADAIYPFTQPQTEVGFKGLDRYSLGGTDLMVNTLSSLVMLSTTDLVAGRVLQEFLVRMRNSHTVFSRNDQSRIHHEIDIPTFSNCWSFFEEPS